MPVRPMGEQDAEGNQMRELKYEAAGGSGSGHPELEEIAAFLDGRLSTGERVRITEHLSVCEECLDLFSESAQSLGATSAGATQGGLVPFPSRSRSTRRWLAYAAAAILVMAAGLVAFLTLFTRPEPSSAQLLEPLRERPGLSAAVWVPDALRGAPGELAENSVLSFLAGANIVGYAAAVEASDSEVAARAAHEVGNHFATAGYLEIEADRFREAQLALEDGASTQHFASLVDDVLEAAETRFFPVHLGFGEWAQAGYIAAGTRSRAWFEGRKNRRFLSYLLRQDEEEIAPEALAVLRRIEVTWEREPLGAKDFEQLAGQFRAILDRYQTLSEQDTLLGEE